MISKQTRALIRQSLREDIGRGDVTTVSLVPKSLKGEASIEAKVRGVLCGGEMVKEVFRSVDPKLKVKQNVSDGRRVGRGAKVFRISGKVASILKGERVALNFLSHLSGIATVTDRYVQKIKGTRAKIYDTRKTTPLWRKSEKYAVKTGGGRNHRFGLWDEVLVKDNHWAVIRKLQKKDRSYLKKRFARKSVPMEIEVANLKELGELIRENFVPDRILLDNFSVSDLKRAVKMVRKQRQKVLLEASGGITLDHVRQVAQTGVDRISIGALTHSAPVLDFSLTLSKIAN